LIAAIVSLLPLRIGAATERMPNSNS